MALFLYLGFFSGAAGQSSSVSHRRSLAAVPTGVPNEWLYQFGSQSSDYAMDVALVDPHSGNGSNVFMAGYMKHGVLDGNKADKALLMKLTPSGEELWGIQFGTLSSDFGVGLATDGNGTAVVVGYTSGSFPGYTNLGGTDAFLAHFDHQHGAALGTVQWGTAGNDYAEAAVFVPGSDELVVVGRTYGEIVGETSAGGDDAFILRIHLNGTQRWARQFGSPSSEHAIDVVLNGAEDAFAVGYTYGSLPGAGAYGNKDGFVTKYRKNGTVAWLRQFGTGGNDYAAAVVLDASEESVYVAGGTMGMLGNEYYGGADAFVMKLDAASGTVDWVKQFGSNESETVTCMARRPTDGWLFVGGYTKGRMGRYNVGGYDGFLAAISPDGFLMWTRQVGTAGDDYGQALAFDTAHMAYFVGMTSDAFNPEDSSTTVTNKGEVDAFLTKIDTVVEVLQAMTLKPTPAPTPLPTMFVDETFTMSPLDEAKMMLGTVCRDQAQQKFVDAGYTEVKLTSSGSPGTNADGNVDVKYSLVPLTCATFGGQLRKIFIDAISMCVKVKADQVQMGECIDKPVRRRRLGLRGPSHLDDDLAEEDRERRRLQGTAMELAFAVTFERTDVSGLARASSFLSAEYVPDNALLPVGYWTSSYDVMHWWEIEFIAPYTSVLPTIRWATEESSGFWSAAAIDYTVTINVLDRGWEQHASKTGMPCEGIRSDELAVIAEKITAIRITITKMCHEDGIVSLRQVQLVAIPGSSKVYPVLGMASSSSFLDTAHGPVQALEPQGYWSSDADSTHWWKLTLGAIHTNVQIIIDWTTDLQIGSIAAQEYSIQTSAVDPASTWSVHFSQTGQWGDCEKARTDKIPPIQEKLVVFKVVVNMGCHPEYVGINHIVVNGYPVEKAEPIFQLSGRALASTYDSPPFEPNFAVKEPSYWMSKPEEEHWWMMTFDTVYSQTDITINWADLPSGETLAARDYAVDFQGDIRQQNLVWKVHHVATEVPCSAARTDVIPWNPQALQRIRFSISKACMGTKVVGIATVVVSGHAMDKQLYTIVPKATVSSELDDAHSGGEVHTSGGHWSSAAGNDNNWWEGEMPASYHNADLQVYWASWWEGVSLAPQFFEVLISMDGITWTTVYTKTRTKAEACAVIESVPEAIPVIEEPFNYIMINMTDSCSDEGYVGIKQITLKGEPAADVGTEPPLIDEIATSSESSSGNADDALVDGGHWLSACCDADGRPGRHWWALDMSAEYTHLVLLIRWTSQLELGDDLGNGAPATFSVEVALNPPVKYETVFKSSNSDCDASVQRTDTIPKIVVPVQWIRISSFDACRSDDRIALSRVSVSGYPLSMSGFTAITGVATASTVNDDDHNANKAVTSVPGFWLSVAAMPPHWWSIDLLVIYIDVRIAISWETSLQSGSTAALQYSVDSSINSLLWLVQYSEEAGDCEALVRIDEWPRIETLARFIRISSTKSCHIDGMVGITEVVVQGTIFTAPIYEVCGDVEASSYIPHHDVELVLSSSNWWQTKSTAAASHWMKLDLPAPFTNLYTVLDWKTDVGAPGDVKVSGGPVKNSLFVDVSSNGYTTTQMGIATEGTCTVNKPRVDGIHIQRQPGQVITLEAIEMCNQENFLALTEVAVFGTPLELQLYEIAGNATASTSSGGTSPGGPLLRVPEVWSSEAVVYPISTQWWSMDLATKFTNVYVRLWWGAAQIPSLYKMETSADEKEWKTHYTYDNDACGLKARQDVLPPVLLDTHYIRIFVVKSCYGGVSLKRANIKGYPLCTPKTGIYYPEGVVTGSSSLTPEYSPSNAFPGLGNAFWATEISPSHWWKVHLSWDYSFVAITIQWAPPLGSGPLAARNYFVSSSLDGVKWIQDFSRMDAPCDAFERVDALPLNAALVRFIMIEIDVSCHPDNIVGIYRVLIRGHSANEPPATLPPLPAITGGPTKTPTAEPTIAPTDQPVMVPTFEPTLAPVELALPEAPTELLCSGLGEMSATLGWVTPADGGSPITMFRVYAKLPDDDGFAPLGEGGEDSDFPTDAPPAGGDMIENDVGGLRSGQKYKFKVSAITPVGEGPLSGSVECTTKGTAKQVSNAPGGDEEGGGASGGVGLILYIFVGLVVFLACVLGVIAVLVTYNSRGSFFGYSNVEVSESHTEKHDRRSRRDDRDGGDYRRFDDDPGYRGGGGGRGGYSRFDDGPGGRNPDYFHHDSAALSEHRPRHHDDEHHGRHHGESHSGGHHSSHHRSAHEDSLNDWMQIARDNYFIFFTDTRTLYIPYSTAISIHDGTHVLLDDAEYAKLKRRAAKDSVTFVELDEGEWPTRPLHTLTPAQVATILDSEEVESFAALIRKHRVNGRMLADMQERDIEELAGGGPDALDALNTIVQRMKRDRAIEVQLDPGTLTGTKLVLVSPRPKYSRVDANGIPTHDAAGNPLPEEEIAALRAEFEAKGKIADVTASQARGDKPKYSHVDANGIPTHDASGNPLPEEEIAGLTASLVDAPQKYESELYSHFDANGTPTHDASGKPLPKEVIAALRAEMETTGKIAGVTASQVKGDTPQKYSRFAADGISTHSTSGKPLPEKEIAALRVKKEKKEKQQAKKEAMLLKRKERQAKEEDSGDPSSSKPVGFNLRRPKQVRASRHADEHAALPVMGGSVTILEIPQNVDELESLFDQSTQDQQVAVMAKQKAASASLKAKLKQRRMQRRNSTASALKAGPEVHLVKPKQVRASRHADGPTVAMPIFGGAAPVLDLLELEDTAAEVEASRIRRKRTTTTTTSETIVTTTTTACRWLEENSDEMVDEGDIVEKLRSGVLLCTVLRQIEGSGMTRFHVDAKASGSDAKSGANFVMVRSSCRRLGIADSFVLTPADLDRRDLPRIVSCLAALSEFKRTTTTVEGIEMIVKWLSEQSGEVVSEADIVEKLRSGVLLCTILRKIDGSSMDRFHTDARASVDDAKSGANFLMIRSSCRALSIEDKLILTPADLDRRDLARIVLCLTALATLTSAASAASPKAEVLKRRRRHMTTMTTTTTTTMTMTTVLNWLQAYYEEEISESDIAEKLRSGVLLCTILRQLDGSRMTRFHADADASGADAKSGANFVMIRSSCRHLGIADGLILTAADLDRRDLERIVSCLAALVELTSSSSSVTTSATTTTRTVLRWLQRYSDEVSESNIVEKLRSGVLLCTVLRQLSGSGMTRFHADASASGDDAKSGANFVMIRSSCRRLAIDDALILAPADLDRRDLPRIVSCLAALAEHDRSRNSAPERSSGAAASGNNSSSSALALCVAWLQAQQFSVDRASIAESLRSGVLLCSVLEQINGASIAHFHRTAQSGAHARANFVLYRAACRRVGIADDAIIRQEDVVRNDVDRIVPCLRTLIDLAEKRQTTTKGEVSPPQAESRVV